MIPGVGPRQHFAAYGLEIRNPAIQALLGERRKLDLRHIQPRAFLGRVMGLEPLRQGKRLLWREDLVEGPRRVRIESILNEPDHPRLGVMATEERLHEGGVILGCPSLPHFHIAEARMGLEGKEDTTRPVLLILIMVAFGFPRTQRQDAPHVFNQKTRALIKAEQGSPHIIGELILLEPIFHMPEIVARNLSYTPLLREPRLEVIFFSNCRTLSCEMESVTPSFTTLSAIKCKVHRAAP